MHEILIDTSKRWMELENKILPESRSPSPLAGPRCFSKGEDEGSCMLETDKLLSIPDE